MEDLRWLPGLTDEDIAALAELVTVHNPSGKVNMLAAPDAVLLALPGATAQAVTALAALRQQPIERVVGQTARLFDPRHTFLTTRTGAAFRVQVEVRRGTAEIGTTTAILIRAPSDEAAYLVTEWREGRF